MKRGGLILLCALVVVLVTGAVVSDAALAQPKALIDEATVTGGTESQEAKIAEKAGFEVNVVSDAAWKSMSQAEFGQYQLLIVGDPTCSTLPAGVIESASAYGPVVMGTAGGRTQAGNRVLVGTDPVFHDGGDFESPGARGTIIRQGIGYAGEQPGRTGMYFDASCAGELEQPTQILEILAQLSAGGPAWTIDAEPPCGGNVSLIASNPAFSGVTTESLEGWNCSVHESFPTFPSEWSALAVATDTESHPTCGVDPSTEKEACGEAYILIAGSGIVVKSEQIELTPVEATNPVGTDHTVTAHVTSEGTAVPGVVVTFTVTGVNAGASGTCEPAECKTDSSGNVSFTYHDGGGEGEDTIHASFVNEKGSHEEATAVKHWVSEGPPATETKTSLSGGGQTGETITVKEGTAVTDQATISGEHAASATGTVTYKVYTDSKCEGAAVEAGAMPVTEGSVPASEPETLAPGTYYWQASYSGDESNAASKSACGSEVETVQAPPPPECTTAIGSATVVLTKEGERERQSVTNKLYTHPTAKQKQKLVFKWENGASEFVLTKLTSASCTVLTASKVFTGKGEGTVNGEEGWLANFSLRLSNSGTFTFHIRMHKPKEEAFAFTDRASKLSSEAIF